MSLELEIGNIWAWIFKQVSFVLGLVKLLSSADMLMTLSSQITVFTVIMQETVEPNCHSHLPKYFADIFSHYFNIWALPQIGLFRLMTDSFYFPNLIWHLQIQAWIAFYCISFWRGRMGYWQLLTWKNLCLWSRHSISVSKETEIRSPDFAYPHVTTDRDVVIQDLLLSWSRKAEACWSPNSRGKGTAAMTMCGCHD